LEILVFVFRGFIPWCQGIILDIWSGYQVHLSTFLSIYLKTYHFDSTALQTPVTTFVPSPSMSHACEWWGLYPRGNPLLFTTFTEERKCKRQRCLYSI